MQSTHTFVYLFFVNSIDQSEEKKRFARSRLNYKINFKCQHYGSANCVNAYCVWDAEKKCQMLNRPSEFNTHAFLCECVRLFNQITCTITRYWMELNEITLNKYKVISHLNVMGILSALCTYLLSTCASVNAILHMNACKCVGFGFYGVVPLTAIAMKPYYTGLREENFYRFVARSQANGKMGFLNRIQTFKYSTDRVLLIRMKRKNVT